MENKDKWLEMLKENASKDSVIPDELGLYLQDWLKEQNISLTGCSLVDNPIIFEVDDNDLR